MKKIVDWVSTMHPLEILFRAMLTGIGLLLFAFAAWQAVVSIQTISTYDKYTAIVNRCSSTGSPSSRFNSYRCEVKYQVEGGRRSASIDKLLLSYDEGDQVDIYISRGQMYSVRSGGYLGLWGISTLLTIIGSMFLGFGVWPHKEDKKGKL